MQVLNRFLQGRMGWTGWAVWLASSRAAVQTTGARAPDTMSDLFIPLISQLGLGAVMGFVVGFVVKKVSKMAAIIAGLAFVLVQVLGFYGLLTIDWEPIKEWWDQATRPDQLQGQWVGVRSLLFSNALALGGAAPGFILGLKWG